MTTADGPHPIGALLDALGVEMQLTTGMHVTEVIVVAKVVDFAADDNVPALALGWSKGLDWIARSGLLREGRRMLDQTGEFVCDSDDSD